MQWEEDKCRLYNWQAPEEAWWERPPGKSGLSLGFPTPFPASAKRSNVSKLFQPGCNGSIISDCSLVAIVSIGSLDKKGVETHLMPGAI